MIRDKLKCYICFGKVINATMCPNCKKIACEECIKKMLSKNNNKCDNCNKTVKINDMIKLPFMNDLTSFFINKVEKKNPKKEYLEENLSDVNNINQSELKIIPKRLKSYCKKNIKPSARRKVFFIISPYPHSWGHYDCRSQHRIYNRH